MPSTRWSIRRFLRRITPALVALALVLIAHPVANRASADARQLTGTFYANNHGVYYIQQSGNDVWWMGESASDTDSQGNLLAPNSIWHRGVDSTSVFRGAISGGTVTGDWVEVNRGKSMRTGTMTLAIGLVTDANGTHVRLSLSSGTSPNGDTDWVQGDQLNDFLYVYPRWALRGCRLL